MKPGEKVVILNSYDHRRVGTVGIIDSYDPVVAKYFVTTTFNATKWSNSLDKFSINSGDWYSAIDLLPVTDAGMLTISLEGLNDLLDKEWNATITAVMGRLATRRPEGYDYRAVNPILDNFRPYRNGRAWNKDENGKIPFYVERVV